MNDQQLDRIWNGMLDAERIARYYTLVAERMAHRHVLVTLFIVLSATVIASGLIIDFISTKWLVAVSLAQLSVAIWASYYGYSKKTAIAATIADECRSISLRWRELWFGSYDSNISMDAVYALEKELDQKTSTREIVSLRLGSFGKVHNKSTKEAYKVIEQEFSSNPSYV